MIFVNRNVDSLFGLVWLVVVFSLSLCSGRVDSSLTGADNGAEPFDDARSALQYQVLQNYFEVGPSDPQEIHVNGETENRKSNITSEI